jgi:nucleotide-binding universal stress UspA family protein
LRLGIQLAVALKLPATVLGVVESPDQSAVVEAHISWTLSQLSAAGIVADTRLVAGNTLVVIESEARRGDYLTVIGPLSWPLWRRLLRGSAIRHLLNRLAGPVLYVGQTYERLALQRVLICSGGLRQAGSAAQLGGQIATAFDATVTLLHIARPVPNLPGSLRDIPASAELYLQGNHLYARNLRQILVNLTALGVKTNFRVRGGDPLTEILAEAHAGDYDLLVIGSHAVLTWPARLVGGITHRVVERAGRPVLVVKEHRLRSWCL